MKTPREILFERHHQVEPKLDAVRRKALAALPAAGSVISPHSNTRAAFHRARAALRKAWLELIWPSRRAWAGMTVIWLVVLAANLEMKATTNVLAVRSAHTRELVQAFEEQQRLLAELLIPTSPPPTAPAHSNPGPRSERLTFPKAG